MREEPQMQTEWPGQNHERKIFLEFRKYSLYWGVGAEGSSCPGIRSMVFTCPCSLAELGKAMPGGGKEPSAAREEVPLL